MAQILRTNDHSIWFTKANFREAPGEGVLAVLSALPTGQTISLVLNGMPTLWVRFAGGAWALRAGDAIARQMWDAIRPGTWVALSVAPSAAVSSNADDKLNVPHGSDRPKVTGRQPTPSSPTGVLAPQSTARTSHQDRLFDAYVFIDWSANNRRATKSGPNQLWVGEVLAGSQPTEEWFPARLECARHVEQRLLHHADQSHRVLVGFDFSYGYPFGFAEAARLQAPAGNWRAIWTAIAELLNDDERNRSNRFDVAAAFNTLMTSADPGTTPGPFWNTPAPGPRLTAKSPVFPYVTRTGVRLSAWRICEERLRKRKLRPHSTFKLYTSGGVGSQALTGIPVVHRLRFNPGLCRFSLVWPFETGFHESLTPEVRPFVVHAEIWPGLVKKETRQLQDADPQLVKDQAQVRAMCQWADGHDLHGTLGAFFSPAGLSPVDWDHCVNEEGWILGTP